VKGEKKCRELRGTRRGKEERGDELKRESEKHTVKGSRK
jgi:hypothetical protein